MPDQKVNVLLIGGGGREHALAKAIARSSRLGTLWVTHDSNPGIGTLGHPIGDVPVNIREIYRLQQFRDKNDIGLVVVGPENPLADGFADQLATETCRVFGPKAGAARLEADKAWAKDLMRSASIPTADSRSFTDVEAATLFWESRDELHVIKASGLAAGKGVILPSSQEEGSAAIRQIMVERVFGDAGETVIIEERLSGPEVSVFALVDGRTLYVLEPCRDHKRLGDGDTGPNTGGMGAYCSGSLVDDETMAVVQSEILVPTIDALRREGIEYTGVLYTGVMLTHAGPKVLEYNVRFGDPECQVLMPRLETDIIDIMLGTCTRSLGEIDIAWKPGASCTVVLAAHGYPHAPRKGDAIRGLEDAESIDGVAVFHAGTATRNGQLVTAGGRVLNVTGMGADLDEARDRAYAACERIHFDGMQMRTDIGARAAGVSR